MRSSLLMERFAALYQRINILMTITCLPNAAGGLQGACRPVPCHPGTCPCPVLVRMDQYGSGTAGAGKLRHLLRLTFAATARSTPPRPATGLLKPTHPTGLRRFPATKGGGSGKARYHLAWARLRHNSRPPARPPRGHQPAETSGRFSADPRIQPAHSNSPHRGGRRQRRGMASLRGDGVMDACRYSRAGGRWKSGLGPDRTGLKAGACGPDPRRTLGLRTPRRRGHQGYRSFTFSGISRRVSLVSCGVV